MCIAPITIKNSNYSTSFHNVGSHSSYSHFKVSCGKCGACLRKRVREWVFRLGIEEMRSTSAIFTTLTYDDDHLIYGKYDRPELHKPHFQHFIRELRRGTKQRDVKYYAVGEYGGKYKRPHYHAIMFNVNEETINKYWTRGLVFNGTVTNASIAYCCGYVHKKIVTAHQNYSKSMHQPEFSLMSKGLGQAYILDIQNLSRHLNDKEIRIPHTSSKGSREKDLIIPRYYIRQLDKLGFSDQAQVIRALIELEAKEHELKTIRDIDTPEKIEKHSKKLFTQHIAKVEKYERKLALHHD